MSTPAKVGVAAVLVAAIGVCVWSLVRSVTPEAPPTAKLRWECSKCETRFEAPLPEAARTEEPTLPQHTCPKCGGAAFRVAQFRCTNCGHEFELTLRPDPDTGQPPVPACPKCNDRRVAPVVPHEKTK